jgi:UDP-N-acetylmuramate--alanine ligase
MDIYPARELPIEGVTSDLIYKNVRTSKQQVSSSELLNKIEERLAEFQILLTIGAGDIDRFIHPIHQLLTRKISLN